MRVKKAARYTTDQVSDRNIMKPARFRCKEEEGEKDRRNERDSLLKAPEELRQILQETVKPTSSLNASKSAQTTPETTHARVFFICFFFNAKGIHINLLLFVVFFKRRIIEVPYFYSIAALRHSVAMCLRLSQKKNKKPKHKSKKKIRS